MLLAAGNRGTWAQVWLIVSDRLTLAATWPADADADRTPPALPPGRRAMPTGRAASPGRCAHGGELLGVLRLQERPGLPLTPSRNGSSPGWPTRPG